MEVTIKAGFLVTDSEILNILNHNNFDFTYSHDKESYTFKVDSNHNTFKTFLDCDVEKIIYISRRFSNRRIMVSNDFKERFIIKSVFSKKCKTCKMIMNKSIRKHYCSESCHYKAKEKARINRNEINIKRREKITVFKDDADKNYFKKEAKEDINRIKNCSVECLLEELGDIE